MLLLSGAAAAGWGIAVGCAGVADWAVTIGWGAAGGWDVAVAWGAAADWGTAAGSVACAPVVTVNTQIAAERSGTERWHIGPLILPKDAAQA